jgi:pilus assembly protein CpaF
MTLAAMLDVDVILELESGELQRLRRPIANRQLSIGRHATNDICLDGDLVSRRHAVVDLLAGGLRVADSSSNGTRAAGRLLRGDATEVPYGAPIQIGSTQVRITLAALPAAGSPAPPRVMAPTPAMVPSVTGAPPALPVAPVTARELEEHTLAKTGEGTGEFPVAGQVAAAASARVQLRKKLHKALLENLDLAAIDPAKLDDPSLRPRVLLALRRIVAEHATDLPPATDVNVLIGELADEALGLGPLEGLLADPTVNEVMVVDADTIYVERRGKLTLSTARFTDDERARACIERIVTPLGRRIDESSPLVDARLKDGSRVNAVIRPIALRGTCITIRKFAASPITAEKLVELGAMTEQMLRFLKRCVIAKRNIVISGGTGSGKTTLLNALSASIPSDERIVTIEDAAELRLPQPHVVSLETRPPNMEGKGELSMRHLVKNALRMRPDRIMLGECRGGEALDMLQAMNTGHEGSMTTTHANTPREGCTRLETLALMGGLDLPQAAIREQIAASVHLFVQASRLSDGSRRVTDITEVIGLDDDGHISLRPIFRFVRTGTTPEGKTIGEYRATGYLPAFLDEFIVRGFIKPGEPYL